MSDQITGYSKIVNDADAVIQWDFSYIVESAGKINNFCVVVLASEMTDPTSESEAKTKANAKAAEIKSAWVVAAPPESVVVSDEPESVTLP